MLQNLTLTLLTHKSPEHTIVSIEINHFLYKLNQFKVKLPDFNFFALGTNGLAHSVPTAEHILSDGSTEPELILGPYSVVTHACKLWATIIELLPENFSQQTTNKILSFI